MILPSQDPPDAMNTNDESSGSRPCKQRPEPLVLPPSRTYGTADSGIKGREGSSAGTGQTQNSGLLSFGSTKKRCNSDSMLLWSYAASPNSPLIRIRDHCHQQWVAILLAVSLLLVTFYFVFGISAPMRAEGCTTPFGDLLGESRGVAAYSNCRHDYGGDGMEHFVSVGLQRMYTGFKWHAVEYTRRYWILTSLLIFPPFSSAEDIMLLESANAVNGKRGGRGGPVVPLERYTNLFIPQNRSRRDNVQMPAMNLNGEVNNLTTNVRPTNKHKARVQPNDLIVYAKNSRTLPSGHAAVVTAVHGPFCSVAAAGKEVYWFIVKNASAKGRQPLKPDSTLPRLLLANDKSPFSGSGTEPKTTTRKEMANLPRGEDGVNATAKEEAGTGVSSCPVLFYKVYIVEQNWDNSNWETLSYLTGSEVLPGRSSAVSNNNNNTEKLLWTKRKRKDEEQKRNHSRVLLLHEYVDSNGFFLEDTHNNLILGWVRASPSA